MVNIFIKPKNFLKKFYQNKFKGIFAEFPDNSYAYFNSVGCKEKETPTCQHPKNNK